MIAPATMQVRPAMPIHAVSAPRMDMIPRSLITGGSLRRFCAHQWRWRLSRPLLPTQLSHTAIILTHEVAFPRQRQPHVLPERH